jgi:hypothetical protein
LKNLASIDPVDLEISVPAMIKGMLNSPNEFTDSLSYSTLFPSKGSDASTIQINGRNRPFAIAANKMMNASRIFLKAYGSRIGKLEQTKLLADVEVRCAMHVFGKRSDSRSQYESLTHIASAMYSAAFETDQLLPKLTKLDAMKAVVDTPQQANEPHGCVRELRADGSISNEEMMHRGFAVGVEVLANAVDDDGTYTIVAFDTAMMKATIQANAAQEGGATGKAVSVNRVDLLRAHSVKPITKEEAHCIFMLFSFFFHFGNVCVLDFLKT